MTRHRFTARRRLVAIVLALAVTAVVSAIPIAAAAQPAAAEPQARPLFQSPFTCGQTWSGLTRPDHSPKLAVDFRGGDINGQPVVASAPGTVHRIEDRGDTSYGKVVFLEHADGWFSTYAHLSAFSVKVGDPVGYGTKIGTVGTTGNSTGPHLHYEQRTGGYLGTVEEIHLDGAKIYYYGERDYTSRNGCDGSSPYTPQQVCGDGFDELEARELTSGDTVLGKAHLLADGSGNKCVATLKYVSVGQASPVSAYVEPEGGGRVTDSGSFQYYAGPATAPAAGTCVRWGASIGDTGFDAEPGHCG